MDLEYHRVGDYVDARASGTAKEIASLVLELQGKPGEPVTTDAIRRTLLEQLEECGQHPASVRQIDS